MTTRAIQTAAVVALLAVTVGCTATPTATPTATAVASPTATPSPTPSLSREQQEAADVVLRFFEIQNQIAANYDVPLDSLYEVAGGELAAERLRELQGMRVNEWTQVGAAVPDVRLVVGEDQPFQVDVCVDTSRVDIRDKSGASVVAPGNPTLILHRFTIAQVGDTLRATRDEVVETPC